MLPRNKKTLNLYNNDTVKWEHDGKLYCLYIQKDDEPLNPRKDWDNPGTLMACWHSRYRLGDEVADKQPEDFWQRLVRENVLGSEILEAARTGRLTGIRLAQGSEDTGQVDIYETSYEMTALGNLKAKEYLEYEGIGQDEVADYLLSDLTIGHCMVLLEPYAVWLNLWLYDHSGITMSCGAGNPFDCQWDSGQAGWIITTRDGAIKEMGYGENDWRERSLALMETEVKAYDQYLTGDVYGFTLYKVDPPENTDDEPDWEESDSCWGFFGADILENGIEDHVCCGLREAIGAGAYETGEAKLHTYSYYSF